jgi:hypothetical protein
MNDNPYRPPADPVERAPTSRWSPLAPTSRWSPLATLKRCGVLYLAAFGGFAFGNCWTRDGETAGVMGGCLGLAVAVVWLIAVNRRGKP